MLWGKMCKALLHYSLLTGGDSVGKTRGEKRKISDLGAHSLSSTDEWKENKWKLQVLSVFNFLFNSHLTKQFVFTKDIFK